MKTIALVIFTLLATNLALAGPSGQIGSGGGDLCEARFESIAEDLKSWILKGGPARLNLPAKVDLNSYSAGMLAEINLMIGKKLPITCTTEEVLEDGHEKTCKWAIDASGSKQIVCNLDRFYSGLKEPDNDATQYVLVHHEFASMAGFEPPKGPISTYLISDQITGFLENQIVKKLVIKPLASQDFQSEFKKRTQAELDPVIQDLIKRMGQQAEYLSSSKLVSKQVKVLDKGEIDLTAVYFKMRNGKICEGEYSDLQIVNVDCK